MDDVAISVNDLRITYPFRSSPALEVERFQVRNGESVLIVGKSGSGKSTLTLAINGVIPHLIQAEVKGEVMVLGKNVSQISVSKLSRFVGTLLQDPDSQIFNYLVPDEIAFALENFMVPPDQISSIVSETAEQVGITKLLNRDTISLSGGEKQRVMIASILAMKPEIIILDEPTSSIDPKGTAEILSTIAKLKESGKTLIIVEHKVERVIPFVDRVVLIDAGRIVADFPKEHVIEYSELLSEKGIEVPEHFLYMKRKGLTSINGELNGFSIPSPARNNSNDEVLSASIEVNISGTKILETSISLKRGERLAIMGNNGAGKSTLLKAIMGILESGAKCNLRLLVAGRDLSKSNLYERSRYVAYLPQNFEIMFTGRSVIDEIKGVMKRRKVYNEEFLHSLLSSFSLEGIAHENPLNLSIGQKRRVALATVLASGAKVIMLDEPTSGQDWYHRRGLGEEVSRLSKLGYSFMIVTHDSRFVYWYCDRVVVMRDGKITDNGTPEEIFLRNEDVLPPTDYIASNKGVIS
ncbi:ABC transporter ATP-binding protein [Sulfolobales archaeon HS-7]|nr:ABC transporter ATP-binding protein [Sulfolobales archaeon HS-7]